MGLSGNQARFLGLTSRQIDLEQRVQQICQRRLRLSNELQRAANNYNNATSDRRMFLNTAGAFSSAQNTTKGPITHDNLLDNNVYEPITPQNLYDNGLHLFMNGVLLNVSDDGSKITKKTGVTIQTTQAVVGDVSVGDWPAVLKSAPYSYRISSEAVHLNTPNIVAPTSGDSGVHSGDSTSAIVIGTANTSTVNGAWVAGALTQNPATGAASQIFTRTCSKENIEANVTKDVPVTQMTMANLNAGTKVANAVQINGVNFNQYTYVDYAGRSQIRLAIGDVDAAQAKTQLAALGNDPTSLNKSFILMSNADMSGINWKSIGGSSTGFSGIFDGNGHTISNMNIDLLGQGDQRYQGMFGNITGSYSGGKYTGGVVTGVNLNNATIKLDSASGGEGSWIGYVGGIAGMNNNGSVTNCNVQNINIDIAGGVQEIGGVVGHIQGTYGLVDKSSATGTIDVGTYAGDIGGLVGWEESGSVTRSYSNMAITIGGNVNFGAVFIGDGNSSMSNCYAMGSITAGGTKNNYSGDLVGDSGSTGENCYKLSSGTYYVYNGNASTPSSTTTDPATFKTSFRDATGYVDINGTNTPVWIFPGETGNAGSYPILNNTAVNVESGTFPQKSTTTWTETITKTDNPGTANTYDADQYQDITISSEDLEAGMRDGSIKLAKHADAMTQNPVTYTYLSGQPETFEYVDWRVVPIISDDLYTENDEAAQMEYDKTTRDVNTQDKQLQLEQNNAETEYTAITNEKEAVKKILETNAQGSFKYFG